VLRGFAGRAIEFIPRTFLEGYSEADRKLVLELARASGCAVELNVVLPLPAAPDGWRRSVEFAHEAAEQGLAVHPMFATNRLGAYFALASTFLLDELPAWRETLTLPIPQRCARLRDRAVREALRADLGRARSFKPYWPICVVEAVRDAEHRGWLGKSVSELAAERGTDPLDCFLDLSLEEDLETTFAQHVPMDAKLRAATESLIRDPLVTAGSSDAGAHLLSLVGVDYTTRLLTEWAPEVLPLEAAVAKLTGIPAAQHGLANRGVVREGAFADLVLLDLEKLRAGETRLVRDFPVGSARLVVDAEGYVATLVNGQLLFEHGKPTGALSGRVLRGGA
jgi:N-acyl-D-aspartate/D-glutamate deacylase